MNDSERIAFLEERVALLERRNGTSSKCAIYSCPKNADTNGYCHRCSTCQGVFNPKRGQLVSYIGDIFYFQPNASSCYLYEKGYSLGIYHAATWCPSRKSVVQPTAQAIDSFLRKEQIEIAEGQIRASKDMAALDKLSSLVRELHLDD